MASSPVWKWVNRGVPLLIGLVIAVAIFRKIGFENVARELVTADLGLVGVASAVYLGSILLKMVRWSFLSWDVPRWTAFRVYLIGQAVNQAAPTGSGELARIYIGKTRQIPVKETMTGLIVERLSDTSVTLAVASFLVVGPGMSRILPVQSTLVQLSIPIAILGLCFLLVWRPTLVDLAVDLLQRVNPVERLAPKIHKLRELRKALETLRSRRSILLVTVVLTVLSWLLYAVAVDLLLRSLGQPVYFPAVVMVALASELIAAFSFLPGGTGVKEGAFAFLLAALYGAPLAVGGAATLLNRVIADVILFGGALGSIATLRRAAPMEAAPVAPAAGEKP